MNLLNETAIKPIFIYRASVWWKALEVYSENELKLAYAV